MKTINLVLCLSTMLILSACSSNTPELTLPEMETLYQQTFQSTLTTLQQTLTLPSVEGDTIPALQNTSVQTTLTAKTQTTFQGTLSYTSTTEKSTTDKGNTEKATHTLDLSLQNLSGTTPLVFSGTIDTFYADQTMHFNIQDFNLFMGEGNVEVNFINLLAKDLAHKRVTLDENEKIWISTIETPELSALFADIATIYLTNERIDTSATDQPSQSQKNEYALLELSPTHLEAANRLYTLLAEMIGIPLATHNLMLDTATGNTITYTPWKNNKELTVEKYLHYRSDTHTFTVQLMVTPKEISWTLTDIVDLNEPNQNNQSFSITLLPQRNNTYSLHLKKYENQELIRNLQTEANIKKADQQREISFQGTLNLLLPSLSKENAIPISFKGTTLLQPSTEPSFTLTWTVIKLSDLF